MLKQPAGTDGLGFLMGFSQWEVEDCSFSFRHVTGPQTCAWSCVESVQRRLEEQSMSRHGWLNAQAPGGPGVSWRVVNNESSLVQLGSTVRALMGLRAAPRNGLEGRHAHTFLRTDVSCNSLRFLEPRMIHVCYVFLSGNACSKDSGLFTKHN